MGFFLVAAGAYTEITPKEITVKIIIIKKLIWKFTITKGKSINSIILST